MSVDASEGVVSLRTPLGKWGVGSIVPAVTNFVGAVTAQYGATFDYKASFQADINGYRNNVSDLAWVELWATDHGQTDYFYCGKTKALEVPMSMIAGPPFPTYTAIWKGLGEGRAYDLYLKYRLVSGDESQLSAAVATNITNLGIGTAALAVNPNLATGPVVVNSGIVMQVYTINRTGAMFTCTFQLTLPTPYSWIKSVVVYVQQSGLPAPNANSTWWVKLPFNAAAMSAPGFQYILNNVTYELTTGYDMYLAYEDTQGNIGSPTAITGIAAGLIDKPVYVDNLLTTLDLSSGAILTTVPLFLGSGSPVGVVTGTFVPSLYFNSSGSSGSLLWVWDGTTWHAFA